MKKLFLFFTTLVSLFFIGCNSETQCTGICTYQYVSIPVEVQDRNGNPIRLDSAYVINKTTGILTIAKKLEYKDQINYTIATDSDFQNISKEGTTFHFTGLIGSGKVEADFVIGKDCCHILKIEGPETIIVNENLTCPESIACSKELKAVSVSVKDPDNNSILLDSVLVTNLSTNETFQSASIMGSTSIFYLIADDGDLKKISPTGTEFKFQAWQNDILLIDTSYTIAHDCCHVFKLNGPNEIILDGQDCLQQEFCYLVDCAPIGTINIKIQDKSGSPIVLDKTEICARFLSECRISIYNETTNEYAITLPEDFEKVTCRGTIFSFKGWQDNQLIINEEYKIGKNCCGLELIAGEDLIIMD